MGRPAAIAKEALPVPGYDFEARSRQGAPMPKSISPELHAVLDGVRKLKPPTFEVNHRIFRVDNVSTMLSLPAIRSGAPNCVIGIIEIDLIARSREGVKYLSSRALSGVHRRFRFKLTYPTVNAPETKIVGTAIVTGITLGCYKHGKSFRVRLGILHFTKKVRRAR